jgi:hypothetical protein
VKFSIRSLVVLSLAAGVLAVGCGKSTDGAGGSAVVTVGRQDAGETVTLRLGQRLHVDLTSHRKGGWVLVDYPQRILGLRTKTRAGDLFDFVATAAGEGSIRATFRPECGPPLPAVQGIQCPVGGANGGRKPTLSSEPVLFKLAVRVEPPSS